MDCISLGTSSSSSSEDDDGSNGVDRRAAAVVRKSSRLSLESAATTTTTTTTSSRRSTRVSARARAADAEAAAASEARTASAASPSPSKELSTGTADALRRAREAARALRAAQEYRAEDAIVEEEEEAVDGSDVVDDADDDDDDDSVLVEPTGLPPTGRPRTTTGGRMLRLALRTNVKGGGERAPTTTAGGTDALKVRSNESLQSLAERYRRSKGFGSAAPVKFLFDGQTLDPNKTPGFYDKEDEDLVDVVVDGSAVAAAAAASSSSSSSGELSTTRRNASPPRRRPLPTSSGRRIPVKLRINGSDASIQRYSLRTDEPFRALLERFSEKNGGAPIAKCSFVFDGERLRPEGTPGEVDMEGDEIVDVVVDESLLVADAAEGTAAARPEAPTRAAPSASAPERPPPPPSRPPQSSARTTPERVPITVQTIRNNGKANVRPKKFRLYSTDPLSKLKSGYVEHYKKKGCRKVTFHREGSREPIRNESSTLSDLGVRDMDVLRAVENGRKYVPPSC